jgi:hypothetical protein
VKPIYMIIPLNVAKSAWETSQNAKENLPLMGSLSLKAVPLIEVRLYTFPLRGPLSLKRGAHHNTCVSGKQQSQAGKVVSDGRVVSRGGGARIGVEISHEYKERGDGLH